MADEDSDPPEQQHRPTGSPYYNINVNEPDKPTIIGDGTNVDNRQHTHIEDNRTAVTITNYIHVTSTKGML